MNLIGWNIQIEIVNIIIASLNLMSHALSPLKQGREWSPLSVFSLTYSPFHKNLPKSCLQMNWIPVRFYETGDIIPFVRFVNFHS